MHGLLAATILLIGMMNISADPTAILPRAAESVANPIPAAQRLQAEVWQALHSTGDEAEPLPRATRRFRR
jgi:hypothetical protein